MHQRHRFWKRAPAGSWIALGLWAGLGSPASAQCKRTEQQVLLPPVVAAGDIFAGALEIDGDVALVANEWDDDKGKDSGSCFFYRHDGTRWNVEQQVYAKDARAGDNFGRSVDIQGNVAVIGAHWDDTQDGANAGSVYVFNHDGTSWNQVQKLRASDGGRNDRFGATIALDGNVLVVGAWLADNANGTDAGAAYVFRHDGTSWKEEQILLAGDRASGDKFGWEGALQGNVLVVGAWKDDLASTDEGSAYVFRHDGTRWVEEQKLTASDATQGDNFGACVSIDGNRILVGANVGDGNSKNSGTAYLYEYKGSTWVQEAKLESTTGGAGDAFGFWLAVDGDRAIIGAWADDDPGKDGGAAFAYDLQDLTLDTDKDQASQGDSLSLNTCGGLPQAGYLLSAVDINGQPIFLMLAISSFDATGAGLLGGAVPAGLSGNVVQFQSLGFDQVGELGLSNRHAVTFL